MMKNLNVEKEKRALAAEKKRFQLEQKNLQDMKLRLERQNSLLEKKV